LTLYLDENVSCEELTLSPARANLFKHKICEGNPFAALLAGYFRQRK